MVDDVSVGYEPGKPILKNLSLRIDMDDRIALLGANGNGKSTLVKLIANSLQPERGEMKRSTDNGIFWHSVTSADFKNLVIGDVAYGNNVWLAGGANGSIWRSVNDSSTLTFLPVFAGDGKFVYTGQ